MPSPLIATKLIIPPLRAETVPRPHLFEKLTNGLGAGLILISAPAGFGKTTLIGAWLKEQSLESAWFSIDESDNDPARFWSYLVAALQTIWPQIGQEVLTLLQASQPVPAETMLTVLVNEIAAQPKISSGLLVLDDLHLIDSEAVLNGLIFLLEHQPVQLQLVIVTRTTPDLPLARLRARGQLTEIGPADLRFTHEETATFLNRHMHLSLSEADIAALETRTEGWIAGLQMAGLSLQGSTAASEFIQAFSGRQRFVLDYLLDEVLQRETEAVQNFLLQTAILKRLCAPLCTALTGRDDSQRMLEELEAANLFLTPLDYEREWFRFHPLFADLLYQELQNRHLENLPELHKIVANWFAGEGDLPEAIRHALAGDDFERAARWIEAATLNVLARGEVDTVVSWLAALPEEIVQTRPWLCVFQAWLLMADPQPARVEALLQEAEANLKAEADSKMVNRIQGYTSAIRAITSFIRSEIPQTIEYGQDALERLTDKDFVIAATTGSVLGGAYSFIEDFPAAIRYFRTARQMSIAGNDLYSALIATGALGQMNYARGHLREAHRHYQNCLRLAKDAQPPPLGYAFAGLADVLREWNDLTPALAYASRGVNLCKLIGQTEILLISYSVLARVQFARGELDQALITLEEAAQTASRISDWSLDTITSQKSRLWLVRGDLDAVQQWAQEARFQPHDQPVFHREPGYLVLARLLIQQGKIEQADKLLERLHQAAAASERIGSLVEIRMLQALNATHQAHNDDAFFALQDALTLAQPEGFQRIFLDEGEALWDLLLKFKPRFEVPLKAYVDKLLGTMQSQPAGMIETLSERETEVLRLLAAGHSNRQIAEQLYVSLNTIKAHVKNIYAKLGVHNRAQASIKAQELKLL